jgi:putative transposase
MRRRPVDKSRRWIESAWFVRKKRLVHSTGQGNAAAKAESINGLYKTEVIRRRGPWRNVDDVEHATLTWVDWFNNRRLLEPLGFVPPAEYEAAY